jgi:hypothetical protein
MIRRSRLFLFAGLALSLLLAAVASYYASPAPDGLEKVAADEGLLGSASGHGLENWPLAGYAVRGLENARLSGGIAGAVGALLTLLLAGVLFRRLARGSGRKPRPSP